MKHTTHLGNIASLQHSHSSGGVSDFVYNKKIKIADMLTHLDQIKHTFSDKLEVYNYLLNVMKLFKSISTAARNVAQHQLYELLQEYFEVIMSFITFCPSSYKTEELSNDPEYDLEVSFILHNLAKADIAILLQNDSVFSLFMANPFIQSTEKLSFLHTSQRLNTTCYTVIIHVPANKLNTYAFPPPMYTRPCVITQTTSQTLNQNQTLNYNQSLYQNQTHYVMNRGQKRKRTQNELI